MANSYTVTSNGTIKYDWEIDSPEEYKAQMKTEAEEAEADIAA